jgi:hypothetical protein
MVAEGGIDHVHAVFFWKFAILFHEPERQAGLLVGDVVYEIEKPRALCWRLGGGCSNILLAPYEFGEAHSSAISSAIIAHAQSSWLTAKADL